MLRFLSPIRRPFQGPDATEKFLPIPSLLLTTVISLLLLGYRATKWYGSEHLASRVQQNRSEIAIAVQVLSQVFGLLQIFAISAMINLSFRHYCYNHSVQLDLGSFINAIYSLRLQWSLPYKFSIPLALFVFAAVLPSALWSACLTPVVSERTVAVKRVVDIQKFDSNSTFKLDDGSGKYQDFRDTQWGPVTFNTIQMAGPLLNAASSATQPDGSGTHSKLDGTQYTYLNRSYGAGAVVGFNRFPRFTNLTGYTYYEPGIEADVSCMFNETSNFTIAQNDPKISDCNTLPRFFGASGTLPNSGTKSGFIFAVGWTSADPLVWATYYANKTVYLAIATPELSKGGDDCKPTVDVYNFSRFNTVQCKVNFTPKNFSVDVNVVNRTIVVTPQNITTEWPSYGDRLLGLVTRGLSDISANDGGMRGSKLGAALRSNAGLWPGNYINVSNDTVLRSTGDFVLSIIDNTLVQYSSAQILGAKNTTSVNATLRVPAVVFGSAAYIYVETVFNLVIAFLYIFEAIRTRYWRQISRLSFLDIKNLIIGASQGGRSIAEAVERRHQNKNSHWAALPDDKVAGNLKVKMLQMGDGTPAICPEETLLSENTSYKEDDESDDMELLPVRRQPADH